MEVQEKKPMIKLFALYEKTTKNGDKFFSGKLGDASVLVFKNNYKKEEKHPDWVVYLQEPMKKESSQSTQLTQDSEEIPF